MSMSASISIENVLLPSFVTVDTTNNAVSCACRSCGTSPAQFDTLDGLEDHLQDQLKIFWFNCPVPHCTKVVPTLAGTITTHIKEAHPKLATSMHLNVRGRTAIFCKDCDRYSTRLHYHCYECERDKVNKFFLTKEERDAHLSTEHTKWFLEHGCKHKAACRGKSGACGFNHLVGEKRFIAAGEDIPDTICSFDQPWANKRCTRVKCAKDHFWGRVRFLINKQKKFGRGNKVVPAPTPAPVAESLDGNACPCDANRGADCDCHEETFREPSPQPEPSLKERVDALLNSDKDDSWALRTCEALEEIEDALPDLCEDPEFFDQMRSLIDAACNDCDFTNCYLSVAEDARSLLDGVEERSATEARLMAMVAAVAEVPPSPAGC